MADELKAIGNRIRELRKERGLSQEQLAFKCGKTTSYIGAIERGRQNTTIQTLANLASMLDVSLGELVASRELRALREVDDLLRGIPEPLKSRMLPVVKSTVALLQSAASSITKG